MIVDLDRDLKIENIKKELKTNLKMIGFDNQFSEDILYQTFRNTDNNIIVEVSVGLDKDMVLYTVLGTGYGEIIFHSKINYEANDILTQISANISQLFYTDWQCLKNINSCLVGGEDDKD